MTVPVPLFMIFSYHSPAILIDCPRGRGGHLPRARQRFHFLQVAQLSRRRTHLIAPWIREQDPSWSHMPMVQSQRVESGQSFENPDSLAHRQTQKFRHESLIRVKYMKRYYTAWRLMFERSKRPGSRGYLSNKNRHTDSVGR